MCKLLYLLLFFLNYQQPSKTKDKLPIQAGNMTDCAVLQFIIDLGETYQPWRDENPEESYTKLFEFTPARRSMTTITKPEKGVYKVYTKGAAEILLSKCVSTYSTDGQIKPFDKDDMERVLKDVIDPMQQEALKILCIAYKSVLEGNYSLKLFLCVFFFFLFISMLLSLITICNMSILTI